MHVDLIIPAYNEAENLRQIPERLLGVLDEVATDWTYTVHLVVSEGSTDDTVTVADSLADRYATVESLHRSTDPGFGNAIKDGLAHSDGDVAIPFMADYSDDPRDVATLVDAIRDGYDFVYGSRFDPGGEVSGYPPLKLLYNRSFNNLTRFLFGIESRDVTNAFSAYRREVIEGLDMDSLAAEDFDITAELPIRAHIQGYSSTAVPVTWHSRDAGVSKLNATQKGPLYVRRVAELFVTSNIEGLRELYSASVDRNPLQLVGSVVLGFLIIGVIAWVTGVESLLATLRRTDPVWVLGVAVVYPVSFVFRAWRWRVLLRTSGHLARRDSVFNCLWVGWFFNSLLPVRSGDVIRGLSLRGTDDVPFSVGMGTVVIERVLDMLVLGAGMFVVTTTLLRIDQGFYSAAFALGIAAVLVAGLAFVYFFADRTPDVITERLPRFEESVAAVRGALRRIADNPYGLALAAALSVPVWLFEVSTLYLSARAVGVSLSAVDSVAAAIAAFVIQAVPLTPGGIGTYEGAIVGMLTIRGVDPGAATALAIVDHFTRLGVTYVVGGASLVWVLQRIRRSDSPSNVDDRPAGESIAHDGGATPAEGASSDDRD